MKSKQAPYCVRQGDVLLVAASYRGGIPVKAKEIKPERSRLVLAHGEVTGHAHAIAVKTKAPAVRYFDEGAERFIAIAENASLTHEEHGAILLNPENGHLQQAFQVEDFGEEIRRVVD